MWAPTDFQPDEVDILLQGMSETHQEWANGAALFGPGGFANDQRKRMLAVVACDLRETWDDTKFGKLSESALDREAHRHEKYTQWLDAMELKRAKWLVLDAQRDAQHIKLKHLTYAPR